MGIDFLYKFGIAADFAVVEWCFSSDPAVRYALTSQYETPQACCGLTSSETDRLAKFLKDRLPEAAENPDVTSLTEHAIDVEQHRPIK